MEQKDNANPIVYQSSSSSTQRPTSSSANSEWWRDHSIHSTPAQSVRAPSSTVTTNSIGIIGASTSSSANNLASSFARATRSTLDLEDDAVQQEDEDKDMDDIDGDEAMRAASSLPTSPDSISTPPHTKLDESIDSQEIYDLIRSITDPEHPLTLEQLAVVNASHITVSHGDQAQNKLPHVLLEFTPTIPHCSMATLIGLSLRVRLLRALPDRFKVDIRVRPGTHQSENAVNKQLNDKERVAAALENSHLFNVVQGCLASAGRRGKTADEVAGYMTSPPSGDSAHDQDHQAIWKTVDEITTRMGIAV